MKKQLIFLFLVCICLTSASISADWAEISFGGTVTISSSTPTINSITPANESTDISITPTLYLNVTEPQSQNFNIYWSTNASSWTATDTGCSDGNYSQVAEFASAANTTYWFTVAVNDTDGNWNNQTYQFKTSEYEWTNWSDYWTMTQGSGNSAPTISTPYPSNTSTAQSIGLSTLYVTIQDADGDNFNWSIEVNNSDNNSANGASNGTKSCSLSIPLAYNTTYTWYVNVTDGEDTTNASYTFTTIEEGSNNPPTVSNIDPPNDEEDVERTPSLSFNLTDVEGDALSYNVTSNISGSWSSLQTGSGLSNGTQTVSLAAYTPLSYLTTYYWNLSVSDGTNWTNTSYSFTTLANTDTGDDNDDGGGGGGGFVPPTDTQPDDTDDDNTDIADTPGFEILIFIASIVACVFLIRRRKL